MYSVITQEKTPLRDSRGGSVYRRVYLGDMTEDLSTLPVEDAPGSLCYIAENGKSYVLNHLKRWCPCPQGGVPWIS